MRRTALGDDRGSVVAEFAVALPAVIAVVLLAAAGLAAGSTQVRLESGAADAARLAARGESVGRVTAAVAARVPGAHADISRDGDMVCVTGRARAVLPLDLVATGCAVAGE